MSLDNMSTEKMVSGDFVREAALFLKGLPFEFYLNIKGPNKAPLMEKGEDIGVDYVINQMATPGGEFIVKVVVDLDGFYKFLKGVLEDGEGD